MFEHADDPDLDGVPGPLRNAVTTHRPRAQTQDSVIHVVECPRMLSGRRRGIRLAVTIRG